MTIRNGDGSCHKERTRGTHQTKADCELEMLEALHSFDTEERLPEIRQRYPIAQCTWSRGFEVVLNTDFMPSRFI